MDLLLARSRHVTLLTVSVSIDDRFTVFRTIMCNFGNFVFRGSDSQESIGQARVRHASFLISNFTDISSTLLSRLVCLHVILAENDLAEVAHLFLFS